MRIGRTFVTLSIAATCLIGVAISTAATAGSGAPTSASRPRNEAVVVQDISIPVPGQAPVDAWLVRPADHAAPRTLAGVIYLHWLEPPASTQNRSEFLDEAVTVAEHGAVAILPDLTFPWTGTLAGDATDVTKVKAQEFSVKTTYQALLAQAGVDPRRTAVVGHDYGAMYGSLLAADEPNIRAEVYMSGDATWSNWFFKYFLTLPDSALPAYNGLFAGLDPVDNVARMRSHLYLQWGGQDFFIDAPVRNAFSAADPQAKVSLYANSDHFLDQAAKDDRIPWLLGQLDLH